MKDVDAILVQKMRDVPIPIHTHTHTASQSPVFHLQRKAQQSLCLSYFFPARITLTKLFS